MVRFHQAAMPLQAADFRLPYAVTAVYPFGAEHNIVDPKGLTIVDRHYDFSPDIIHSGKDPITAHRIPQRTPCRHLRTDRSIGSFLGQPDDFIHVHNQTAARPIEREWMNWAEEYQSVGGGKQLRRLKRGT
jgi:hypothetical protein